MIAFLLSLLNEFPSHEFNFCSLERQRANILQTQGHNFSSEQKLAGVYRKHQFRRRNLKISRKFSLEVGRRVLVAYEVLAVLIAYITGRARVLFLSSRLSAFRLFSPRPNLMVRAPIMGDELDGDDLSVSLRLGIFGRAIGNQDRVGGRA